MKFTKILLSFIILLTALIFACNDSTQPNNNNNNNKEAPIINELSKYETYPGYPLEITGDKFGSVQESGYVEINGKKVTTYLSWSVNAIKVIIPVDATSGKVVVKIGSLTSNSKNLVLLTSSTDEAPIIKAFDVTPLPRSTVGIEGSYFGDTQDDSFVTLNGVVLETITSWRDKKIVVKIPTGATSGNIIVYVKGKSSNEKSLTIQEDKMMLEQVLIPSGTFQMGASDEPLAFNAPVHEVTISKPFYMSKYEITQANWNLLKFILGGHNSLHPGDEYPVERVAWINACKFCNALSGQERFEPVYTIIGTNVTVNWNADGYRLPTEAEWEWAARAGSSYKYGKGENDQDANINRIAWHAENSENNTHGVGTKEANAYGLYDMMGNVMEWCWDWFDADYYESCGAKITDPRGAENSDGTKVLRGGSYTDGRDKTTVSYRWSMGADILEAEFYMGFRVVRNAK